MRLLVVSFLLAMSTFSNAQEGIDLMALQQCTMINHTDGNGVRIGWWMTDYYWEYVMESNASFDPASKRDILNIMGEYNLFAVVVGKRDYEEVLRYPSTDGLRNTMILYGQDSAEYYPLEEEDLSEDLQFILDIFRPVFSKILGEFGENLHIFVFPKTNDKGELIADPLGSTDIKLTVVGEEFDWNIPLDALLPEKKCPEDGELHNGSWNYCPFHGNELVDVED